MKIICQKARNCHRTVCSHKLPHIVSDYNPCTEITCKAEEYSGKKIICIPVKYI